MGEIRQLNKGLDFMSFRARKDNASKLTVACCSEFYFFFFFFFLVDENPSGPPADS